LKHIFIDLLDAKTIERNADNTLHSLLSILAMSGQPGISMQYPNCPASEPFDFWAVRKLDVVWINARICF
jgi:hypothetical protein